MIAGDPIQRIIDALARAGFVIVRASELGKYETPEC